MAKYKNNDTGDIVEAVKSPSAEPGVAYKRPIHGGLQIPPDHWMLTNANGGALPFAPSDKYFQENYTPYEEPVEVEESSEVPAEGSAEAPVETPADAPTETMAETIVEAKPDKQPVEAVAEPAVEIPVETKPERTRGKSRTEKPADQAE